MKREEKKRKEKKFANNESASCQKQIRKPAESGLVLIISLEVN
jgi:hypothetical protein